MRIAETNVGKMEAALRAWGIKLDKLMAKAEAAGTEAKVDYRRGLDELGAKYKAAQARLNECKTAGSDKWEIFQTGLEAAWDDLETAFRRLGKSSVKAEGSIEPQVKTE